MVRLTLTPGDYSIRPRGNQIEITSVDREMTREEAAAYLGRTERSIDLYRNLPDGPLKLKSRRIGGRIYIRQSEVDRWLSVIEDNPNDYPTSDRPRKKRRTRLAIEQQSENGPLAEAAA